MMTDDDWTNQEDQVTQPKFASFWSRAMASILDTCIFIPIVFLSQYNIFTFKSLTLELLLACTWIFYKPFMEYHYGATLGKMTLKLQVVNEQFQPITLDQSVKRFVFYFLGYLAVIFINYIVFTNPDFMGITEIAELGKLQENINAEFITNVANIPIFVSIVSVIFDPQNQALHDKFAETYCIDLRPNPPF